MKIAIVVHGRFHAFDLARELIRSGQDVCVLTNYPKSVAAGFGIPSDRIRNNLLHGIVSRAAHKIDDLCGHNIFEPAMHRWFSCWAAKILKQEQFDVVHGFSGVCEEIFRSVFQKPALLMLVRGSAHIEEQFEILATEERRTGCSVSLPSSWIRQRESREYALADYIVVLSHYAYGTFVKRGVPPAKLRILFLGAQLALFRPASRTVVHRCQRIRRGEPIRVLTVGSFSLQKGAWDYLTLAKELRDICRFRFVGTVERRAKFLKAKAQGLIEFVPRTSQHALPEQYAWGDVFLFLTIHDGYAVVLAQALASALPILSTANCAAPDIVKPGATGWVFPIRRPDLFIEKLRWCDRHREELADMVEKIYHCYVPRDWSEVARDFVTICADADREMRQKQADVARV